MKLNKKKVFVAALAICVVAILSFGTLAWFTAEDTVENSFKVTTSDDVGTPDFSLVLFEHKVDPETGKIASTDEVKSNEYKNIVPGITVDVPAPDAIVVKGIEKDKVGQFAADIRSKRPPEPYKGKGVSYAGEVVILKEGKSGKK